MKLTQLEQELQRARQQVLAVHKLAIPVFSSLFFDLLNEVFFSEGDIYFKFRRSISIDWWKWYGHLLIKEGF